jgi:hypothetical protein
MKRLLAVIAALMILSGCTTRAPMVPTITSTPRPTVTPLGKQSAYVEVTRIVIATETKILAPSSIATKIGIPTDTATPTNTPTPEPTPSPTHFPEATPDGLVLYYSFDTAGGNSVTDQSSQSNNGVVNGPTFTSNGRLGGAISFDGVNDFIFVPASANLNVSRRLTMMAYFNAEDYQDQRPILEWSLGVHMWVNVYGFQWNGKGTGANLIDVGGDGFNRVISVNDLPPGNWHHLAVAYDGDTGRAQVYLDGQLAQETLLKPAMLQTQYDLYMGTRPPIGPYFKGRLDEVRIYNRVLTGPEIASLAQAPLPESGTTITQGLPLRFARMMHTATRLLNGKILLVGGSRATDDFLSEVELFDPVTGTSSRVAPLHTSRHGHTATLLPDGRVLVVGGYTLPQQWLADAEVYDPAANTWTLLNPPHKHGVTHTTTLLKDGRVLVVGGCIGSSLCTDRVDLFDPQTNTWSEAASLPGDRASHTANLLDDGRVLVAGGGRGIDNVPLGGDALLYDPPTNTWAAAAPMVTMRLAAQSVRLADGRVLVTGGLNTENPANPVITSNTEVYNPISNTWTSTADLAGPRYQHNLVILSDGRVLAVGGERDPRNAWTTNSFVREIELYDPLTAIWHTVGNLPKPRTTAATELLSDGRVWLTGGWYMDTYWSDSWLIGAPSRTTP